MTFSPAPKAQSIMQALSMKPHPEGGWYAETFRAPCVPGARPAVSAIYFLLQQGERSHWHRVDACEIWLWHAGAPVQLRLSGEAGSETVRLGPDIEAGEHPQAVVPEGVWQSAEGVGLWSLVSCVVAPAFDFAGFTMAPRGWSPDAEQDRST